MGQTHSTLAFTANKQKFPHTQRDLSKQEQQHRKPAIHAARKKERKKETQYFGQTNFGPTCVNLIFIAPNVANLTFERASM